MPSEGMVMSQTMLVRVGRRRTLVIPKAVAEALGIREGSLLELRVEGSRIVLEPVPDAVEISLHGRKIARATLEELESESVERQREYIEGGEA